MLGESIYIILRLIVAGGGGGERINIILRLILGESKYIILRLIFGEAGGVTTSKLIFGGEYIHYIEVDIEGKGSKHIILR